MRPTHVSATEAMLSHLCETVVLTCLVMMVLVLLRAPFRRE